MLEAARRLGKRIFRREPSRTEAIASPTKLATLLGRSIRPSAEVSLELEHFFCHRDRFLVKGSIRHPRVRVLAAFVAFSEVAYRIPAVPLSGSQLPKRDEFLFDGDVPHPASQASPDIELWFEFADGTLSRIERPQALIAEMLARGPDWFTRFLDHLQKLPAGRVLEIGSRDRSGLIRRDLVPTHLDYVGFDIHDGANVDVVGDAHHLSNHFAPQTFDAVFSIAVFEHLLMPWLVAVEMNRVMKRGALAFVHSHQAFPLHEEPCDFWRYSDRSWHALFNRFSGFEVLGANMGGPVAMVPRYLDDVSYRMEDRGFGYVSSVVLCRKLAETTLEWRADPTEVVRGSYPR